MGCEIPQGAGSFPSNSNLIGNTGLGSYIHVEFICRTTTGRKFFRIRVIFRMLLIV
jgi:hypothetical protein